MRQSHFVRSLGIALAAAVTLSMGDRPSIQASQAPRAVVAAAAVGGGLGGDQEEPMDRAAVVHLAARPMSPEATRVWLKMQEKVTMAFPNETPLQDVLKFVTASTIDKVDFPEGISIYVDPAGLQDADKTPASTVAIDLKGIPLATTLRLALKQLGLVYRIEKDGFLLIASESSDDQPADADSLILDQLSALRAEVKALREDLRVVRAQSGMMGGSVGGTTAQPTGAKPTGGMGSGTR
jgi:hypothetical protein